MPSSSRKPTHLLAALPAGGVLAARGGQVEPVAGSRDGREHLLLLDRAASSASKRRRLLHRDQRHQLQQVVLDHVAGGADAVVVAGPAADADVLGHRDLHVVDVVAVPDRLEHRRWRTAAPGCSGPSPCRGSGRCGRPSSGGKTSASDRVELARRLLRSWPNGFSIDDAAPRRRAPAAASPCSLSWPTTSRKKPGGIDEVEGVVAAGAAHLVELLDGAAQRVERLVVVEVARHEAEPLGELLPDLLAELRAGVLLDRVVHDLGEVLVGPVAAGEADQREARRQQAAVGEVVDRRHHLLARQVAGDAEEHQPARPGDAREPPVLAGRAAGSPSRSCAVAASGSRRSAPASTRPGRRRRRRRRRWPARPAGPAACPARRPTGRSCRCPRRRPG